MNENLRARLAAALMSGPPLVHAFELPGIIQEQIQELGDAEKGLVRSALVRLRKEMTGGRRSIRAVRSGHSLSDRGLVRVGQWLFELDHSPQAMGRAPLVTRISVMLGHEKDRRCVPMACITKDLV